MVVIGKVIICIGMYKLNPDVMPKLRINSFYSSIISRADQSDDNLYLRNQMLDARDFIKSVDERHKTLSKSGHLYC